MKQTKFVTELFSLLFLPISLPIISCLMRLKLHLPLKPIQTLSRGMYNTIHPYICITIKPKSM